MVDVFIEHTAQRSRILDRHDTRNLQRLIENNEFRHQICHTLADCIRIVPADVLKIPTPGQSVAVSQTFTIAAFRLKVATRRQCAVPLISATSEISKSG